MRALVPVLYATMAMPAIAQESRQLGAHEHGVGELNIAVDGRTVAMEFHAPGADIVGFEYEADSDGDRVAIEAAVALLARPLDLFVLPDAAECTVIQARAELEGEAHHGAGARHSEFHAEYEMTCAAPKAISEITFAYFDAFENAREIKVQIVTVSGAQAFEVERDAPTIDLRGVF